MIHIERMNAAQLRRLAALGQGLDAPAPPPISRREDPPVTDRPAELGVQHREIEERRRGIGMHAAKSLAGVIRSIDRARTTDDDRRARIEDRDCREVLGSPGEIFGRQAALRTSRLRSDDQPASDRQAQNPSPLQEPAASSRNDVTRPSIESSTQIVSPPIAMIPCCSDSGGRPMPLRRVASG